jgi:transcriptional regulator with XRE-family HTH domain
MTVGQRIKLLREKESISQIELAEKIGVSKQNLYKYENDIITNIPSDKIEAIARFLDTTPAYIMGWNDSVTPDEDIELQEYLEELKNRPEMKMLFKTLKGTTKEEVEKTVKIIEALTGTNE